MEGLGQDFRDLGARNSGGKRLPLRRMVLACVPLSATRKNSSCPQVFKDAMPARRQPVSEQTALVLRPRAEPARPHSGRSPPRAQESQFNMGHSVHQSRGTERFRARVLQGPLQGY